MPDGDYAKSVGSWINVWEELGFEPPADRSPFGVWEDLLHPDDKERVLRAVHSYLDGRPRATRSSIASAIKTGPTAGSSLAALPSAMSEAGRSG